MPTLDVIPASPAATISPRQLPRIAVPGLYVHVPFCFHKCHYCDFYSITRQTPQRMAAFVNRILREADMWRDGTEDGPTVQPTTIFFGGGTPSLLPAEYMRMLLAGLRDRFDLSHVGEFTLEANPATVTLEYCAMLREMGVNRLSFGAQSFAPEELALLERHHNPDDVPRSVETARSAGFTRLNVDLIYGIPGQDLSSWMRSLESSIALRTRHISCYGLTYEPNTPMAVKKRLGHFSAVEDSVELEMLHATRRRLAEAGMTPYEISNYAVPGEECRHNLLYWNGGDYIGLGPSAASHMSGTRWKNRPHLGEWEAAIDAGRLPASDVETLSPQQRAGELAMLQLRLARGIDYADFAARSGSDARELYGPTVKRLTELSLLDADSQGFRLTEIGIDVADAVALEMML